MTSNQAAWLDAKDTPLRIGEAPMPTAGPGEIIVRNHAVAINPLDCHMQDHGVFVQQWPAIFGCDVAGQVHEVGAGVTRFKPGDRVVAHTINLSTGKPRDAAFAMYCAAPASKAAILPDSIPFESGTVLPMALEAAVCALSKSTAGEALPGVPVPTLGLPLPKLSPVPTGKTIIVYGGSASIGVMTTQVAVAAGMNVIAIASPKNFELCRSCGASAVIDRNDTTLVEKVVAACADKKSVVGIFDAISSPETYAHDLQILAKLGGGHLACSHPPPTEGVPENVKAGMIFAIDDVATPVWEDFVTPALESGLLKCLPKPLVVGHGLGKIQEALEKCKAGVSATKLVVTL